MWNEKIEPREDSERIDLLDQINEAISQNRGILLCTVIPSEEDGKGVLNLNVSRFSQEQISFAVAGIMKQMNVGARLNLVRILMEDDSMMKISDVRP